MDFIDDIIAELNGTERSPAVTQKRRRAEPPPPSPMAPPPPPPAAEREGLSSSSAVSAPSTPVAGGGQGGERLAPAMTTPRCDYAQPAATGATGAVGDQKVAPKGYGGVDGTDAKAPSFSDGAFWSFVLRGLRDPLVVGVVVMLVSSPRIQRRVAAYIPIFGGDGVQSALLRLLVGCVIYIVLRNILCMI